MWLMILMSRQWYARKFDDITDLITDLIEYGDFDEHVNQGTVVSICDDLETWCDKMGVKQNNVIVVED